MAEDWRSNLQNVMASKGLNPRQLSLKLNKNQHYISQLLKREFTPSVKTMTKIAEALDVPVSLIVEGVRVDLEIDQLAARLAELPDEDLQMVEDLVRRLQARNK